MQTEGDGNLRRFGDLLDGGPRNGIYKSKEFHGRGHKIVNMGELFAYPILRDVPMKRVELTASEDERFSLQAGDLLFARRSLVAEGAGKCCLVKQVDEPTTFESSIIRVRPRPESANSAYLFYYFSSPDGFAALDSIRRQLAVSGITGTDLIELRVPVPPLHEQRAIGSLLGALDDKIDLNSRMNGTIEDLASALFKSWFVDFDPVTAKRDGKTPVGVPAEAVDSFPSHFEDCALGPIPKAWRAGILGEVATNPRSGVSPNDVRSEVPYIGLEHMPQRSICLDAWGHAGQATSGKFRFKQGDFLFGKLRPYFHKVGVALVDGVCSTDILVLNPTRHAYYAFVLGHISSREFIDYNDASSGGTRMPRTGWDVMSRYQVVIPPAETADVLNEVTTPLLQQLRANVEETSTLAQVRDLLLAPLLSGEITVKTAEKTVAEVV